MKGSVETWQDSARGAEARDVPSRQGWDVRTGSNGYKNGMDFIITLVVVNSLKFLSYID